MAEGMFAVLLRHWRTRRGLSQLDLALTAGVSARHLSFLETGRSRPSEGMVLRLAATLDLALRDQNRLLEAAGFPAAFPERADLPDVVRGALDRMLAQQEPFPLVVLDAGYHILRYNGAADRIFGRWVPLDGRPNLLALLFDPAGLRPHVLDWEALAGRLLVRLRREVVLTGDDRRRALLDRLATAELPKDADPSRPLLPTLGLRLRDGDGVLSFLSTLTVFSAPQETLLQELLIESFFPLDEVTRERCVELAAGSR